MTRRTDATGTLTPAEVDELIKQAEDLHAIDIRWVLVLLIAIVSFFVLFGEASGAALSAFAVPFGGCGCSAGKERCDCSALECIDSSALDIGQLIASGAMEAPKVTDRPSLLRRLWAWLTAPEVVL